MAAQLVSEIFCTRGESVKAWSEFRLCDLQSFGWQRWEGSLDEFPWVGWQLAGVNHGWDGRGQPCRVANRQRAWPDMTRAWITLRHCTPVIFQQLSTFLALWRLSLWPHVWKQQQLKMNTIEKPIRDDNTSCSRCWNVIISRCFHSLFSELLLLNWH